MGLQSAHDLLRKLRWEMRQMDQIKSEDEVDEVGAYQAFNAAVTARHVCDWVWETASPELRERFKADTPEPSAKGVRQLAALMSTECRELHICRQLATGAKHFTVERFDDPGISANLITAISVFESEDGSSRAFATRKAVFVNDGRQLYSDVGLFSRALNYWESFFQQYGIQ